MVHKDYQNLYVYFITYHCSGPDIAIGLACVLYVYNNFE